MCVVEHNPLTLRQVSGSDWKGVSLSFSADYKVNSTDNKDPFTLESYASGPTENEH